MTATQHLQNQSSETPPGLLRAGYTALLLAAVFGLPGRTLAQEQTADLPIVRGVAVYGHDREDEMPIIVRDQLDKEGKGAGNHGFITIQFDALTDDPLQFTIKFFHCDRDWKPDDNMFVQDVTHNRSFTLSYVPSPGGVRNYTYRFINKFPDDEDVVRFDFSGNWIFRITGREESAVFAEGRFFVVDGVLGLGERVQNDFITENSSPMNQSHRVTVRTTLPDETQGQYYTTVDIYQNRRWYHPYRIDLNDRDPYTFVEGLGRGYRQFSISNILPGNEYRTGDFSNTTRYPNYQVVRPVEGVDQTRMYWRTGRDHDGVAIANRFQGSASEYLNVLFRLDMLSSDRTRMEAAGRGVYVVGPFNDWEPREEDLLQYDEHERALVTGEWLRRGIYDYQYVTGVWDGKAGFVRDQDWYELEGNDWRTTNTYTAFLYYNDLRFGGFDRIVGFSSVESSGSGEPPR